MSQRTGITSTNREVLVHLGLQVLKIDAAGAPLGQTYLARAPAPSVPDAFALALARSGGHILVCEDRALKQLAEGIRRMPWSFWVLDQMVDAGLLSVKRVAATLETIAAHPRCRLPRRLIATYLAKFATNGRG